MNKSQACGVDSDVSEMDIDSIMAELDEMERRATTQNSNK